MKRELQLLFLTLKYDSFISTGDEYYEVEFGTTRKNEAGVDLSCLLRKRRNV